jgi:alanyl-tRNA synthetase
MKAQLIREKFSNFFIKHAHQKHPSSSLVPHNDNTILFANSGMNQFKDFFTGKANPQNRRAVTIQKCVRAGGKHNDLENVGFTARHHTFFEMLGNFSFGDYFKQDAIAFAWKFLTEELGISRDKLFVTVHQSDDEAMMIWHKNHGVPLDRIFKLGDKTNFWEMGDVGPCGPCTEIFYDHGEHMATGIPEGGCLVDDEGRFVEIWNLVFMQFEKKYENGQIVKINLPKPSVDTGAGLERIAAAMQGKYWNYDTDIFAPIVASIENLTGKKYSDPKYQASFRVVCDHIRSCTMLITDGVIPSNDGRGYVLRRIIRRAVRHLDKLGLKETSFYKLVPSVFESLGMEYPENAKNASLAEKFLKLEEDKFRQTLDNGIKYITAWRNKIQDQKTITMPGEVAFTLYDTYGFPLDLTEQYGLDLHFKVDQSGFEESMQKQKDNSKKSAKFQVQEDNLKTFYQIKEKNGDTVFTGYSELSSQAKLLAKIEDGSNAYLVFDKTPFYAESGGQVGDTGVVLLNNLVISNITDTQKPVDGLHVHLSSDADALEVGEMYTVAINKNNRELTKRNHSATHLLQSALIKTLGDHIKQAGSSVGPDRLRFDFTQPEPLTIDQINQVEALVNQQIQAALTVDAQVMTKEQATAKGAMALFGEKYGNQVRVLTMGHFSCELCGGTHVQNTGEIQLFKILSESSLASGIRRIEATTSSGALDYLNKKSAIVNELQKILSAKDENLITKVEALLTDIKDKSKDIKQLKDKIQSFESKSLFNQSISLKNNLKFFQVKAEVESAGDLRGLSDNFVTANADGILFLYNLEGDRINFILRTHKDHTKVNFNKFLKDLLPKFNGRGGGKPDMAQGSADAATVETFIQQVISACEQF